MPRVIVAEPFDQSKLGSMGTAVFMLLRQQNFPFLHSDLDTFERADHDHILKHNRPRAERLISTYTHSTEALLWEWVRKASNPRLLQFMIAYLDSDPTIKWTGYRAMATIHKGNGATIVTFELFAKHKLSDTKVYSGEKAPNVKGRK